MTLDHTAVYKQHFLCLIPLPHEQGSFLPTFTPIMDVVGDRFDVEEGVSLTISTVNQFVYWQFYHSLSFSKNSSLTCATLPYAPLTLQRSFENIENSPKIQNLDTKSA